jgi:hypothetical protein
MIRRRLLFDALTISLTPNDADLDATDAYFRSPYNYGHRTVAVGQRINCGRRQSLASGIALPFRH